MFLKSSSYFPRPTRIVSNGLFLPFQVLFQNCENGTLKWIFMKTFGGLHYIKANAFFISAFVLEWTRAGWPVPTYQCDQIFVQYLGIYNNVNLPKNIKKWPDQAQHFAQILFKLSKNGQRQINYFQSGEILPNLVTLPVPTYYFKSWNTSSCSFADEIKIKW